MCDSKSANKPAKITPIDRGESTVAMEPMLVRADSPLRVELSDLAVDLTAKSTGFSRSLPTAIVAALADLVRSMNCYYSNLIEGHDTHPIDIERALQEDYSSDPKKRDLQLEAKAHINVQQWIDDNGLAGQATTTDGVVEVHRRFCEQLPEDLLWAENPDTGERQKVVPGQFRETDVIVGRHMPVSPGAVPKFMQRFESAYCNLGRVDQLIGAASAHHRLLWIHPFADGNGRVARLMSYAMLRNSLQTGGVWSIARGFARNENMYKQLLANCDLPRRNDIDGRGNLSEESLVAFTKFFLQTCIDQVEFMERLAQPDRLRDRIMIWIEEEIRAKTLPSKSDLVMTALLHSGALSRAQVPGILNMSERSASRISSALLKRGVVASATTRAPLNLVIPAELAARWMPGLFPEQVSA
ncbi:MAG: Fic family protein [Pseudomonadales bacterium]